METLALPLLTSADCWEGEALQYAALLVDKPLHWTSFDAVKKLKYAFGLKKVGHAGTLDPLATGLLILCTGKGTKQIHHFQGLEKTYTGELVLGQTTPSYDLETPFDSEQPYAHLSAADIQAAAQYFVGDILQVPTVHSAIKKDGKRVYTHARKGKTLVLDPRPVHISAFEITQVALPRIAFRVVCSKGTYIRSLVHDLGQRLGTGAYLAALRRTHIGPYTVASATRWLYDNART